jgi:hypothetical protein
MISGLAAPSVGIELPACANAVSVVQFNGRLSGKKKER